MGKYFGTDGVRGLANEALTPELAFRLAVAGASVLMDGKKRPRCIIGRDTRVSGGMLEAALTAGLTAAGVDVILVGVVPTPAVAFLIGHVQAAAGIMISASHNPAPDNGIKFFDASGFKLSDQVESQIEAHLAKEMTSRPTGAGVGRVYYRQDDAQWYEKHLLATAPRHLDGLHIAVDCANGATSAMAPKVLQQLGARVSVIHNQPTGMNINEHCGSTYPEVVGAYVGEVGADLGLAYDGDGDRLIAATSTGDVVDGDRIMAICALDMQQEGRLQHNTIAVTTYSNGGLRKSLRQAGADVVITNAGDRYVLEAMLERGLSLGGEQSGHIVFGGLSTTGDGILSSLQLLGVMVKQKKSLAQLAAQMPVFPQLLKNVPVSAKDGWKDDPAIRAAIAVAESRLGKDGRIFVRASGTENLIRVMVEHPDAQLVQSVIQPVVDQVALFRAKI